MKGAISVIMVVIFIIVGMMGCSDETTGPDPEPTNHAPDAPTINTAAGAPTDGESDCPLSQELYWQCDDPDGDDLTYDVHFGQTDPPAAVSTDQVAMMYDPGVLENSTTYYWQIVAEDPDGETTNSVVWSFTTIALATETVSVPTTPTGPAGGEVAETLVYSSGGATSSMGHTVQYRFDWDDGSYSSWSLTASASHHWTAAGSYEVRVQARCQDHTSIVSAWTTALTVTITALAETVNPPNVSTTTEYVDLGNEATCVLRWSSSNLAHAIEYQFDFGDGTLSAWMPGSYNGVIGLHTYAAVGAYQVTGRARCAEHTGVVSDWNSLGVTVNVVTGTETISTPYIYSPDSEEDKTIMVGENIQIRATGATSNLAHTVQYRFDMGDGHISPWSTDSWYWYADYSTAGDYQVKAQARCITHTDIETPWSDEITIHVLLAEVITRPDISGPATGVIGELITFTTNGSTSDLGHDLEYRLYVSTSFSSLGNPTDWTTIDNLTYTFTQERTYIVRVQARCTTHTYAESYPSNPAHTIDISSP